MLASNTLVKQKRADYPFLELSQSKSASACEFRVFGWALECKQNKRF